LFTDINLPGGMDGAALARRARDMMPELGVVYASARGMPDAQERVPGSIFVPKPYVPTLVGRLLASTLKIDRRLRSGVTAVAVEQARL
jgi:CheY-like chemotaxis protein